MSPQDFRRIVLAHDLLVRDSREPPAEEERTRPDGKGLEPKQERIPAETAARERGG
jgi:hypothetical protein